jgi:hypothetical protein
MAMGMEGGLNSEELHSKFEQQDGYLVDLEAAVAKDE